MTWAILARASPPYFLTARASTAAERTFGSRTAFRSEAILADWSGLAVPLVRGWVLPLASLASSSPASAMSSPGATPTMEARPYLRA